LTTKIVITKAEDGTPIIRLDRPRHMARLHLESVDELVGVRDAINQHLGDQHAPADLIHQPQPAPQRTRMQELASWWHWLTSPVFSTYPNQTEK